MNWLKELKTSPTLFLFVVSFVAVVTGCYLQMFGLVGHISMLYEVFLTMGGMYFGKKINFKTKNIEVSHNSTKKEVINESNSK